MAQEQNEEVKVTLYGDPADLALKFAVRHNMTFRRPKAVRPAVLEPQTRTKEAHAAPQR